MAELQSIDIWPWNLEPSRSRSQTKVPMETTHEGLSSSDVLKSYWPWSRYNEVISQLLLFFIKKNNKKILINFFFNLKKLQKKNLKNN